MTTKGQIDIMFTFVNNNNNTNIYIHNIKMSCDQQLLEMTGRLPQSAIVEYYSGSMCSTDISAEMRSKLTSLSIQYMDHKRGSLTSEACGNMGRDVFAV